MHVRQYERLDLPTFWAGNSLKLGDCLLKAEHNAKDKPILNTGCKTFDRQSSGFTTGNIIADTLSGQHVRAATRVIMPMYEEEARKYDKRNGAGAFARDNKDNVNAVAKPGHLQDFDLKHFIGHVPSGVITQIKRLLAEEDGIIYLLFHRTAQGKVIHGVILTDTNYRLMLTAVGERQVNRNVVDAMIPYLAITNKKIEELARTLTKRMKLSIELDVDVCGDIRDFSESVKAVIDNLFPMRFRRADSTGYPIRKTMEVRLE